MPSKMPLPQPLREGSVSLEECLARRRSVRSYASKPLTPDQVSQLLWAAQGLTSEAGERTAPSAGALYPLEVYVVAGQIHQLGPGIYHYHPSEHALSEMASGDRRRDLCAAALGQSQVASAAAVFAICAVPGRTTWKYGERGVRYIYMEAGHVAQNVHLQAVALGLDSVAIGAFEDEKVSLVLQLPDQEKPLYLIPVGTAR